MKHFISLGAGVQSTGLALMAKHEPITPIRRRPFFPDTGAEPRRVSFCPYHSAAHWRSIREDPKDWADAIAVDRILRKMTDDGRADLRQGGQLFVHRDCVPLKQADIDMDQLDLWAGECERCAGFETG